MSSVNTLSHAAPRPKQSADEGLWRRYKRTGSDVLRNELMVHYLPLVRAIAERTGKKLPDEVDVNDLVGAGVFGLNDAIEGFDVDYGVKFETYSAPRIRGAILDHLRAMDWVPRLVRLRTNRMEAARQNLDLRNGRPPTDEELAEELQLDREEYQAYHRDSGVVGMVSLFQTWFVTDSNKDVHEVDVVRDRKQDNPVTSVLRRDLKDLISRDLTRAERLIIILYYYEQLTMKEIGAAIDLSESRVSQMHASILARLKAKLNDRADDLPDGFRTR